MKHFAVFLTVTIFAFFASDSVFAQHFIQVDDGAGHFTILKSQTIDPMDVFFFPTGGGTLLTSPPVGVHSLVWLTAGNTGTGGSSSTPTDVLGTTNAFDVVMVANNAEKMRLVSGGGVTVSSLLTVTGSNNFKYVDGNQTAGWILTENASGVASWANPGTLTIVSTATGTAPITVNGDNAAHSGAITIALNQGSLTTSTAALSIGGTGKTVGSNITVDLTTGSLTSGGSLTIGGTGLTVGAGITANLNLANPNNWTGQQTITGANKFKYVDGNQTAGFILTEDGTGQAVWSNPNTLGLVTTATGTAPITINGDNAAHSGAITVALTQGSLTTSTAALSIGGTGKTVGSNITVDLTTGNVTSSGSISIGGTGKTVGTNITADLNLANTNTWTGTQTFGAQTSTPANSALGAGPIVTDYALGTVNSYYRISSTANVSLNGLQNGAAGRTVVLQNVGTFTITLKSGVGAPAADGFDLPAGSDIILGPKGTVSLIYDGTLLLWEVVSTN